VKTLIAILISAMLATASRGGIAGWLTSGARDWSFIQQTGGIRIAAPLEKEGRKVLPVEYYVQGTVAVTCQPTLINSGLAVRKIELKRKGAQLVIRVVTQVVEKGSDVGRIHYGDLADIPAGSYEVFYETAGDSAKSLGKIDIQMKKPNQSLQPTRNCGPRG
jgi:hypothetical protein